MKKFESEEYRIPGTNIYDWSKYSRENIVKSPPRFKVGDSVIFTIKTEVLRVYQDCDGTPLYEVDMLGNGWSDRQLKGIRWNFLKWLRRLLRN
ncbi:MAG: hypothetical protein ABSF21_00945 [Dehalococcoidia bacterium]